MLVLVPDGSMTCPIGFLARSNKNKHHEPVTES